MLGKAGIVAGQGRFVAVGLAGGEFLVEQFRDVLTFSIQLGKPFEIALDEHRTALAPPILQVTLDELAQGQRAHRILARRQERLQTGRVVLW